MVETRTKRSLESRQEDSDGADSADESVESEELDMPHIVDGMMLPYNHADSQPPQEFITLVGGAETFEKLMKCVESFGQSRMHIELSQKQFELFQKHFSSEAQKDSLIEKLQTNVHFFQSFIEALPTYKTGIGESIVFNKVAVSRFQGNQKLNIDRLL